MQAIRSRANGHGWKISGEAKELMRGLSAQDIETIISVATSILTAENSIRASQHLKSLKTITLTHAIKAIELLSINASEDATEVIPYRRELSFLRREQWHPDSKFEHPQWSVLERDIRALEGETRRKYRTVFEQFITLTKLDDISTATIDDVYKYRDYLMGRYSPGTWRRYLDQLRAILQVFECFTLLMLIKAKRKRLYPQLEDEDPIVFTQEELDAIYKAAKENAENASNHKQKQQAWLSLAIFVGYYFSGLRNKEGRLLMLSDIDLAQKELVVRHGKWHSHNKAVDITGQCVKILREYVTKWRYNPKPGCENYLFVSNLGNAPLGKNTPGLHIKKLAAQAGITNKPVSVKILRASQATAMAECGASDEALRLHMRWRDAKEGIRYKNVARAPRKALYEKHMKPLGSSKDSPQKKGGGKTNSHLSERAEIITELARQLSKNLIDAETFKIAVSALEGKKSPGKHRRKGGESDAMYT